MKKIAGLFIACFSILLTTHTFAITTRQPDKTFFDFQNAAKQLAATPKMELRRLNAYVASVEALQAKAKVCVEKTDEELKNINELLKESRIDRSISLSQADVKYFQNKQSFYAKQRSECRLFIYESKEVVTHYKDIAHKLSTHKIFERSTPIWKIPENGVTSFIKNFSAQKLYEESGITKISLSQFYGGLVLLALSVLVAFYIRLLCLRWFYTHARAHTALLAFFATLSSFIIPLTIFSVIAIFLHVVFLNGYTPYLLESINLSLLLFISFFALSKFLFCPPRKLPSFVKLPRSLAKSFHVRTVALFSWIFLGYLATVIFRGQHLNQPLIESLRSLYVIFLSGFTVWLLFSFCHLPRFTTLNHVGVFAIKATLSILFLITMTTETLGYHQLAMFIISGVILTMILLGVTVGIWHFIDLVYQWIDNNKYASAKKIRQIFGIKSHHSLTEILLLKFAGYAVLLCGAFIVLMQIWSIPVNVIDIFKDGLLRGFHITDLKIVPFSILLGVITFSGIILFGRFIATSILRRHQFDDEQETQLAVASLIVYVAFAIATFFALLIMGVNFTGLAIIAGALSVGIGLGLQNIVNNFVSGIILLLEKPVKSGDRVVVGETEGFIKKIRIRSTQITTLAKEDVIVPNSDLITNQVTNYMFRDRWWRVVCKVGVAYGSDIELVRRVLLEVASKHDNIIQNPPNQPAVLFREFGDSSLVFELWSIIKDVNKKYVIVSDLNFEIDAAFRQHGITIAFPQRDLHLKENVVIEQKSE